MAEARRELQKYKEIHNEFKFMLDIEDEDENNEDVEMLIDN